MEDSKGDVTLKITFLKKNCLYIEISHTNNMLKSKIITVTTQLWPNWYAKKEEKKFKEEQQIKVFMNKVRLALT